MWQYGWTWSAERSRPWPSRCGTPGTQVEVLVVTSLGLGTLNHTELTVDALRRQGLEPSGLALGAVPGELGLAERCNLDDLPRLTGVPVVARIPAGAGALEAAEFRAAAPTWISELDPGGLLSRGSRQARSSTPISTSSISGRGRWGAG